jgi:hypothetical protein
VLVFLATNDQLGSDGFESFDCVACQLGKKSSLPFNKSDSISFTPFDLVHSNVWGPMPIPTMGGSRYFVIFVDDFLNTHGFIFYKIGLNFQKFILNFKRWFTPNFPAV